MEDNTVEKNIYKGGSSLLKKLNLFTAFHAIWLIEMYYLGINALFNGAIRLDQDVSKKVPAIVLKYNDVILSYFIEYSEFVGLVAVAAFMCGISIAFIKFLPMFNKYKLIDMYSDYGIYCGLWLAIIYGTYRLYLGLGIGFLASPIIVFIAIEIIKKMNEYIEEKTGISFIRKDYY